MNDTNSKMGYAFKDFLSRARKNQWKAMAIYGAGKHTVKLLDLCHHQETPIHIACVLDDAPQGKTLQQIPVISPAQLHQYPVDVVLISSDAFEDVLYQKAVNASWRLPICRLYEDHPVSSNPEWNDLLKNISSLSSDWHKAGTMLPQVLSAMVKLSCDKEIGRSVETGSGKTTLLLSHLSKKHTVFSMDMGNSMSAVRSSPLFRSERVEWVEGPTQLTLPRYPFKEPIDFALIDGPHGYPFPELEYYYIYQHLAPGALLIIDDIHIPTITNLFNFLKEEAMFELVEVVMTTAFFRRTTKPLFSPTGDGWWLQGYNRKNFPVHEHPYLKDLLTKPL